MAPAELAAARDFLVGVFPLRFETPGPIVGALSGLFVHELPDDELARYRPSIEAVTVEQVRDSRRPADRPVADGDRPRRRCRRVRDGDRGRRLRPGLRRARRGAGRGGPRATRRGAVQPIDAGPEGPTEGAESPDEPAGDGADAEEIAASTARGGAADAT